MFCGTIIDTFESGKVISEQTKLYSVVLLHGTPGWSGAGRLESLRANKSHLFVFLRITSSLFVHGWKVCQVIEPWSTMLIHAVRAYLSARNENELFTMFTAVRRRYAIPAQACRKWRLWTTVTWVCLIQNEEDAMAGLTERFFLFLRPTVLDDARRKSCLQVNEGFYCILAKGEVQSNFLS